MVRLCEIYVFASVREEASRLGHRSVGNILSGRAKRTRCGWVFTRGEN